jgi:hypothetical protein
MLFVRTRQEALNARRAIERIGKLSDNIVGIGPFGIGIDGMLAWVPGLGDVYSVVAGGMLLLMGVRARAPIGVLVRVAMLVGLRSVIGAAAIPLLGPLYPISGAVVDLFRGHKMAANMLCKSIDRTVYVEGARHDLKADAALAEEAALAETEGDRVVFLG